MTVQKQELDPGVFGASVVDGEAVDQRILEYDGDGDRRREVDLIGREVRVGHDGRQVCVYGGRGPRCKICRAHADELHRLGVGGGGIVPAVEVHVDVGRCNQ